ncbi:cytochrome P450 [Alkalinema pantanalense CENA528]|uniref:cytochrome P450 n=1 Tax=Alkalinema pantanalense TaxID=1620705 RepID=UPI003D6E74DF
MHTIPIIPIVIGLMPLLGWLLLRRWYFQIVDRSHLQVHHKDGRTVPLRNPKFLLGNLAEVYRAENRLAAYHSFHEQLGEIVQIFWLWRHQLSIANLPMARHILVSNQKNYQKFRPNIILQKLYGTSVLTNNGIEWQRQRSLMQSLFTPQRVAQFYDTFVTCTRDLAEKWRSQINTTPGSLHHNIYPDCNALFLDIIGRSALGIDFRALQGDVDDTLADIRFILKQSNHPLHQFTTWWQHLPLPQNRQLAQTFHRIDQFLYQLIQQRRVTLQSQPYSPPKNLLDLLLQANHLTETELQPFTDREIRDNLFAIIVNGYESVATSITFTLALLARHPEFLEQIHQEVDQFFQEHGRISTDLPQLPTLKAAIVESLRLYPPMAGLQRVSLQPDIIEGWTIPSHQVIGIPLQPLHLNSDDYGDQPDRFKPERYLDSQPATAEEKTRGCPLRTFLNQPRAQAEQLPLTFGDGARRCLGETFALHEMTIVLAILLHQFTFTVQAGDEAVMELGKFGLFISMVPKDAVNLTIALRQPTA